MKNIRTYIYISCFVLQLILLFYFWGPPDTGWFEYPILILAESALFMFIKVIEKHEKILAEVGALLIVYGLPFLSYPNHFITIFVGLIMSIGLFMLLVFIGLYLKYISLAAFIDPLTQLRTRVYFFKEYIPKVLKKHGYESMAIILIDIDNMKKINDKYTHSGGDKVLKIVSSAIRDSIRRDEDVAVRFGGDEILILLPNMNEENAKNVVKRIRSKIYKAKFPEQIRLSAGIAVWKAGDDIEKVISRADERMYEHKFKKKR